MLPCLRRITPTCASRSTNVLFSQILKRYYKVNGNELEKGMIISLEARGKLYEVLKYSHSVSGRGISVMQTELKDVFKGTRHIERIRPGQEIEVMEESTVRASFIRLEKNAAIFEDPSTLSEFKVPIDMLNGLEAYLKPSMVVPIRKLDDDDKVIEVRLPKRISQTVKEIVTVASKARKSASGNTVLLENGRTIVAPTFVTVGQKILVKLPEEEFSQKVEDNEDEEYSDDEGSDDERR
eukprot:TRINITY_DN14141_c0_g1_i1.p1 TRINITY_DN14141_c0_g1~~TRINITY_DN14141_c0_g1_i1.p1  ORF type:complete len:238 (-),score=58.90 TRINITY_DN14141_c0_g1_i1:83-796(-)